MGKRQGFYGIAVLLTLLVFSPGGAEPATLFQQVGIASSPNPVGSGARALGMGGAFIGIADDATAASWNPAGLIQLERPELSIVGAYFDRKEDFSSSVNPEIGTTGEVDVSSINYFSAAYPFRFYKNMVVSLNYQRLYEFNRNFSYLLDFSSAGLDVIQMKDFDQDGSIGALGLAGAVEITPRLSFGATVNIWTGELLWDNGWTENFSEQARGTLGGVPVTIETDIVDDYSDFRGLNANLGLLWNMSEHFTLGAVVKTPFEATVDHQFRFTQTTTLGAPVDTTVTTRQNLVEEVELEMPLSLGMGLAWRVSDALSVDLDVYWTQWSEFFLKDSRGNKFSPIDGRPKDESDVKDTTQVRIGGEYLFIFPDKQVVIPVRAGLFYDPEPADGEVKDFFGISVGSGIAYKRLVFDWAYVLRWGSDVDTGNLIPNSEADITQHTVLASFIFHF